MKGLNVFRVSLFALLFCGISFADPPMRGDANCDGVINNFDIDPFVVGILYSSLTADDAPFNYLNFSSQDCWSNRTIWGDIDQSGQFNNFDIDPFVGCVLGNRIKTPNGCGITRGQVQNLTCPTTGRKFDIYIPNDFISMTDIVIVSFPGTSSTSSQEMGPHIRPQYPDGWPDCGGPSWPTLAAERENYEPFVVIVPDVVYGGASATICNEVIDHDNTKYILQFLIQSGEISQNGRWSFTGWSSGGSLALTFALKNRQIVDKVFIRYSSLDNISSWNYDYNTVRNCLNTSTECATSEVGWSALPNWSNSCSDNYNWHNDYSLRTLPIYIINNDAETYYIETSQMLNSLLNESIPFTLISQTVFQSNGADPQTCDASPYGLHSEARELAAQVIAGW